jgi:PhzF family phenazine biosynthesis protein
VQTKKVLHFDAFSSIPNKGNPAGIVLEADDLNEDAMQSIAKAVGFNETVFVMRSDVADYQLRFFSPGHEMNLCGHATIGSMFCLKKMGIIKNACDGITVETKAGILPIKFDMRNDELFVIMKQDQPKFIPFNGSVSKLAASIGISLEDIDNTLPIVYGSTGTWTLLVPIKNEEGFSRMVPDNKLFPDILTEKPRTSVHPFAFKMIDHKVIMHARHFSSPFSGTIEDAATGTASGVMGAYYLTYLDNTIDHFECTVEQGQEMEKDGRVYVYVSRTNSGMDVYVSGTGVSVQEMDIRYA